METIIQQVWGGHKINIVAATWIEHTQSIILSEINWKEGDKYYIIHLHEESKKSNQTNKAKQNETHKHREKADCCLRGG